MDHQKPQQVHQSDLVFVFCHVDQVHELVDGLFRHCFDFEPCEPSLNSLGRRNLFLDFGTFDEVLNELPHFINVRHAREALWGQVHRLELLIV